MEPITLGIIAIIQVVALALVTQWVKSKDKKEDWRRQDEVAERLAISAKEVTERATLLLEAQKETIRRTEEVAKTAAEANALIHDQLLHIDEQGQKIHTLVNSEMTTARTNERDQTKYLIVALKQVVALSVKLGIKPGMNDLRDIEDAETKVAELNALLLKRREAQEKIDHIETLKSAQPIEVKIVNPPDNPVLVDPITKIKES